VDLPRLIDLHRQKKFKLEESVPRTSALEDVNEAITALEQAMAGS
jgi:Zn-dependent alcohol dehydrogenase